MEMTPPLTYRQHVDRLVKNTGVDRDHAERVIELAMSNPKKFAITKELIEKMRTAPDTKTPVKGIQIRKTQKDTGRNDLCACGSGKKFKRCCITKERILGIVVHRETPKTT